MSEHDSSSVGFEAAFKLVGGSGRFQMLAMVISSLQLLLMTWNHMGYIFIGAVPKHWCHIPELVNSGWSEEQVKNISIPQIHLIPGSSNGDVKYEQCLYYTLNFSQILLQSGGNFESAYELAHAQNNNEKGYFTSLSSSLPVSKCQKWDYDKSMYISTIVSQFDLVCDQRYKVATGQASYMIGAFVGTLFFGPLNDRILGRRNSTLVSIVLCLTGNFLVVFATSYVMFIATRTLVALGTAGAMQAMGIWFLEHCDTKSRAKLYLISGMFFGVGYAIMPIYAFYLRDWSSLQLAFSVTSLPLLSFFWLLPESPRWLASKGRDEEAVKALERMARINGKPKPSRALLLKAVQHCHQDPLDHQDESGSMMMPPISPEQNGNENEKDETSQVKTNTKRKKSEPIFSQLLGLFTNFKSLLSTKELRKISFTVWALFMAVAFVYYGFAFSTNLTTNPYLLVSMGALMEIPASVLPIPFLSKWGRRPTTVACYCITGLAALSIAITPSEHETARTVLSMIGKLFVASAFTVLYLVVSEVYPTVARSTGQGAGTLMGRVGSIAAPFVADLLTTAYPDLPLVIFGIVALLAAGIALFIPEMKGVDMKDQVYEYEENA